MRILQSLDHAMRHIIPSLKKNKFSVFQQSETAGLRITGALCQVWFLGETQDIMNWLKTNSKMF